MKCDLCGQSLGLDEDTSLCNSCNKEVADKFICPTCGIVCLKKQEYCLQCGTVFSTDDIGICNVPDKASLATGGQIVLMLLTAMYSVLLWVSIGFSAIAGLVVLGLILFIINYAGVWYLSYISSKRYKNVSTSLIVGFSTPIAIACIISMLDIRPVIGLLLTIISSLIGSTNAESKIS